MKTILLVEDSDTLQQHIKYLAPTCQRIFHGSAKVECAFTMGEAKDAVAKGDVDVVMLDLSLPDSCSDDTIEAIKQLAPIWPAIVVVTGHVNAGSIRKTCLQNGAEDFIEKETLLEVPEIAFERLYNAWIRHERRT